MMQTPERVVCPLSGETMRKRFMIARDWRRPDVAESFEIWWCDASGFGQVSPRPAAESIPAFYDIADYYTHSGRREKAVSRPSLLNKVLMALASRVDRSRLLDRQWWRELLPDGARSGLDIGCGAGEQLEVMAGELDMAVGIEPDPLARQAAVARGLTLHSGTAEDLAPEVASRQWDVVVMLHVLEHCLDPLRALRNAHALLRPGGILVVETPNNDCQGLHLAQESWHWLDVPRHLNFFTEASLKEVCRLAGFRHCKTEYWGYTRQFTPDWVAAEVRIDAILKGRVPPEAPRLTGQLLRRALLLARTAFAAPGQKYDSVRLICTRPPDSGDSGDPLVPG